MLKKRYGCLDHVLVALAAMQAGDEALAEEHLKEALKDEDELRECLEELDESQGQDNEEEAAAAAEAAPNAEVSTADPVVEADAEVAAVSNAGTNPRIAQNLRSI